MCRNPEEIACIKGNFGAVMNGHRRDDAVGNFHCQKLAGELQKLAFLFFRYMNWIPNAGQHGQPFLKPEIGLAC
jgi:hypothetical protein